MAQTKAMTALPGAHTLPATQLGVSHTQMLIIPRFWQCEAKPTTTFLQQWVTGVTDSVQERVGPSDIPTCYRLQVWVVPAAPAQTPHPAKGQGRGCQGARSPCAKAKRACRGRRQAQQHVLTCQTRSTRTQTCRRCSRSRRASTACSAGSRGPAGGRDRVSPHGAHTAQGLAHSAWLTGCPRARHSPAGSTGHCPASCALPQPPFSSSHTAHGLGTPRQCQGTSPGKG